MPSKATSQLHHTARRLQERYDLTVRTQDLQHLCPEHLQLQTQTRGYAGAFIRGRPVLLVWDHSRNQPETALYPDMEPAAWAIFRTNHPDAHAAFQYVEELCRSRKQLIPSQPSGAGRDHSSPPVPLRKLKSVKHYTPTNLATLHRPTGSRKRSKR